MFARDSRYRAVPVVTEPDRDGQVRAAVALRPLPDVTGTVRHVVVAGDRLDQLAGSYYGRPRDWWRICDANPGFRSPWELLGSDAVVTTSFPLIGPPDPVPWAELIRRVGAEVGVERVRVVDEPELRLRDGLFEEAPLRALEVTHNRSRVGAVRLADVIRDLVEVGPFTEVGRIGHEVVVPPAAGG